MEKIVSDLKKLVGFKLSGASRNPGVVIGAKIGKPTDNPLLRSGPPVV